VVVHKPVESVGVVVDLLQVLVGILGGVPAAVAQV